MIYHELTGRVSNPPLKQYNFFKVPVNKFLREGDKISGEQYGQNNFPTPVGAG
jgi:hypothetical protein